MLTADASSPWTPHSSTVPGHDAPDSCAHGQQHDHSVAPPPVTRIKTRIRWFKLGARHFAARCPPVTAGVDTTTTTVRKVVTTPPPARGSGGHPWRHHASSCFFRRVQNDMFAPLQGTKHKIGAPSRTPSWLPPPLHSLHRNGPMWFRNSVDPRSPPLLKTGHPTLHTLSPPSPPGAASREVSPGTQRSCCGRVC